MIMLDFRTEVYRSQFSMNYSLPYIKDGLTFQQRACLSALNADRKRYFISPNAVGNAMYGFSDLFVYKNLIIMSQPFNSRYPLIDLQGNGGSI